MEMKTPHVVIIGAGPAGLTAALELCQSGVRPVILEALDQVGGISRTVEYKGNRMDIGGHRFFSKSDWVMSWWCQHVPKVEAPVGQSALGYVPPQERVMLLRSRLSRIYFLRRFFEYPISLSLNTMRNLGVVRMMGIGVAYVWARVFPRKPERHLEDFFINRFGKVLYRTFFKDYTEKVWGVRCQDISPAWGAQRIKGLSIADALRHAAKSILRAKQNHDVSQKKTSTSLIERFLYPKYGPGQMWQVVAESVSAAGGQICKGWSVQTIHREGARISGVTAINQASGEATYFPCDWLISSMPIKDLVSGFSPSAPPEPDAIARNLEYRDFITVGVLLKKLKPTSSATENSAINLIPDTWIYIQEPDVKIGRLQVFNNWSPALLKDQNTVWLGLEYFCKEGDDLWRMDDASFGQMAIAELSKIGIAEVEDALDFHVVRVPKAYPAYFGVYDQFDSLRTYLDTIDNLFLVGRNGMHRYNNQDHSMLTAKLASEMILSGKVRKEAIWAVNVDDDYHEEKK